MVAARAAVDRCTFTHHSAQRQKTARAGVWVRVEAHGEVPEEPTSRESGTQYHGLDDSVPELSGAARPAPLGEPRPQERVQRPTVEQIIETFVPVQILDDPVPLVVDQPMEILKIVDVPSSVEQVIAVPKISCPSCPLRVAVVDTRMAEQLVDVPTPSFHEVNTRRRRVWLARYLDADGHRWFHCVGPQGVYWCTLTTQWDPLREPPPVQGGIQILGRGAPLDASIDLPVIVQLEFQQSFFETVEVPQIQFSDRVLDIPVVTQRWVLTVQIVKMTGKIQQVQCVAADVPVTAATSSSAVDRPFSTSAVFAWLWTSLRSCRRCLRFPSSTRS